MACVFLDVDNSMYSELTMIWRKY